MLRFVLVGILVTLAARAFRRVVQGMLEAMTGLPRRPGVPQRGVPMARDPVCGTFVLPDRALRLTDGDTRVFFCSEACRDKYRARTA